MDSKITKKIKKLGYDGEELLKLMNYYHVNSLQEISQRQAEKYYEIRMEEIKKG